MIKSIDGAKQQLALGERSRAPFDVCPISSLAGAREYGQQQPVAVGEHFLVARMRRVRQLAGVRRSCRQAL